MAFSWFCFGFLFVLIPISYSLFFKLKALPNSIQKHIWNLTRSHEVWKFYWDLFLWAENSNFWVFCSYCAFSLGLFLLFFNLEALLGKKSRWNFIKRAMGLPIISTFYGFLPMFSFFSCSFLVDFFQFRGSYPSRAIHETNLETQKLRSPLCFDLGFRCVVF